MNPPIISVSKVSLSLGHRDARVHVLRDISFDVRDGEAVGLVGPSGSGKSTLLMTLAGLERPDSGSISIAGTEITTLDEDQLAQFRGARIGIVFQSFHLIPTMTALENVAIPLELAGRPDAFEKAAQEIAAVGLASRSAHYPSQLSGGEQQRIAIARALATDPSILIADEPTGNLDEENGAMIMDLIFELKMKRASTLILVTHDPALAARCDRTIHIRSGRIDSISSHKTFATSAAEIER